MLSVSAIFSRAQWVNTFRLRKMAANFLTISNIFSWTKMYKFQWKFRWSLFVKVQFIIPQHWFRKWLSVIWHLPQWVTCNSLSQRQHVHSFQFTHFPCDDWDNIHFVLLSSPKSEVVNIIHYLGLRQETMVCAVCPSLLLWMPFPWMKMVVHHLRSQ